MPQLPAPLACLAGLASNLWWSWHLDARAVFRSISLALWRETRHNPLDLLHRAPAHRMAALADDPAFVRLCRGVCDALDAHLAGRDTWFDRTYPEFENPVVAYFCAEFGLHASVPIYSGGLGVLAGDHCKAASDLGVPLVAVGLLYTHGYFDQRVRLDGWQEDGVERFDRGIAPLLPVLRDGDPALASVRIAGRDVFIGAWRIQVGRVPVFLLDTNLERNDPADRELARTLYPGGPELRFRQEWVLGVGGVRVLRALGHHPSAWHANEGHAAFMLLERVREAREAGASLGEAKEAVRATSTFTTHTPVPAGHDMFSRELIERCAGPVWDELGIGDQEFFALGRHPEDHGLFHMTAMAIRLSAGVNGVSRLHGAVTRRLWNSLWPGVPEADVPIGHVTNGVHIGTWMGRPVAELFDRHFGAGWIREVRDAAFWDGVLDLDDFALWNVRTELKSRLMDFIHETARQRWRDHWTEAPYLVGAGTLLNSGVMTIGFARRFASYKRADLIFHDTERLRRILLDPAHPVQIIFAGKAHPADDPGKRVLQRVFGFAQDAEFEGRVAFLEDYEMHMARRLVQGVDLWLNVPRVPMEACGTSGMKAGLNGVLQLGTNDGWWAEGFTGDNGWRIDHGGPAGSSDVADAGRLYELLERDVVPCFYRRDARGVPLAWVRKMKHAIREVGLRFTAYGMVQEYTRSYYVPALQRARARSPSHAPVAR